MRDIAKFMHSCWRVLGRPWFAGSCRFHPGCSDYALEAVERFGFFHGSVLAIKRILRCQPYAQCGIDPVPSRRPERKVLAD